MCGLVGRIMQLSKNFFLHEFLESQSARRFDIKEQFSPSPQTIENIKYLCVSTLQPIRDKLNVPISISSGYRCHKLNVMVGGVGTSSHLSGLAVDFYSTALTNGELFKKVHKYLIGNKIEFDQLIWEFGNELNPAWVHLGITIKGTKGRKQVFAIGVNKRF